MLNIKLKKVLSDSLKHTNGTRKWSDVNFLFEYIYAMRGSDIVSVFPATTKVWSLSNVRLSKWIRPFRLHMLKVQKFIY